MRTIIYYIRKVRMSIILCKVLVKYFFNIIPKDYKKRRFSSIFVTILAENKIGSINNI